jgi:ABC-2 type transport system ATP-binding protein
LAPEPQLILGLRHRGRAIVISTHNLDEAERVSDRVGVLQRRLVAMDTPGALRQRLFGRRLRVTLADEAAPLEDVAAAGAGATAERNTLLIAVDSSEDRVPDIVRALVSAGARVREVTMEQAPLEQVYLALLDVDQGDPDAEDRR